MKLSLVAQQYLHCLFKVLYCRKHHYVGPIARKVAPQQHATTLLFLLLAEKSENVDTQWGTWHVRCKRI